MMKRWFAVLTACMFLLTGCGGKEAPPAEPSETPPAQENVEEKVEENVEENEAFGYEEPPVFCGTWYTETVDGDGYPCALMLNMWSDGYMQYSYGEPESYILESFEGYWNESDGVLTMEMRGGPVSYDGSDASEYAYDSVCSFEWDYQSRHLYLTHTDGMSLLYGTEGAMFDFLPFNSYLLAGTWSAAAPVHDWIYELTLLENGECLFRISEFDEELALYEGWWFMDSEYNVSLDLGLTSGEHPENPEMQYISGTYLAQRDDKVMDFSFVSGGILTLNMEEDGYETFTRAPEASCVSVYYAQDLAVNWDECDWIIIDDTEPLEAAFCTMVPVEDFTVVSLMLQDTGDDAAELNFEVTPLFEYGTLNPERPLRVILTDYGTIPSYGISFTDPNGEQRLFGVTVSGMDGSLELVEIN